MGGTESWHGGSKASSSFICQGRLPPLSRVFVTVEWSSITSDTDQWLNLSFEASVWLLLPTQSGPCKYPTSLPWVPATPSSEAHGVPIPSARSSGHHHHRSHYAPGPAWSTVQIPSVNGTALFYLKCLYTMESAGMLFHILHIYTSTTSHLILLIKLFLKVFHLLLLTATSTLG